MEYYSNILALPTAPTEVIISEVTATSVRLEWSYKGPEDLQYYVIQYKPKNANQVLLQHIQIIFLKKRSAFYLPTVKFCWKMFML